VAHYELRTRSTSCRSLALFLISSLSNTMQFRNEPPYVTHSLNLEFEQSLLLFRIWEVRISNFTWSIDYPD
jgi:hypothetical protein